MPPVVIYNRTGGDGGLWTQVDLDDPASLIMVSRFSPKTPDHLQSGGFKPTGFKVGDMFEPSIESVRKLTRELFGQRARQRAAKTKHREEVYANYYPRKYP